MTDPILRSKITPHLKIQAKGGLHYLRGNTAPYFSLTMASWEKTANGRWVEATFGAVHDEILKHWPELADLAALHLSDIEGVPMHALENGLYFLGSGWEASYRKAATPDERMAIVARHFRISVQHVRDELVPLLGDGWTEGGGFLGDGYKAQAKAQLAAWIEARRDLWRFHSESCIKAHRLMIYGDPGWKSEDPKLARITAALAENVRQAVAS